MDKVMCIESEVSVVGRNYIQAKVTITKVLRKKVFKQGSKVQMSLYQNLLVKVYLEKKPL
jgi:hypothetical protein